MLVNFWTNTDLRDRHEISFSYRRNPRYKEGMNRHIYPDFPVSAIRMPSEEISLVPRRFSNFIINTIDRIMTRIVLDTLFLLFDVIVLTTLFRRINPDCLHVNNGGYPAARSARAAVIAGKLAGIKRVIMVVNNMAIGYGTPGRWLDYPVDRLVTYCTDIFITGSMAAASRLSEVLRLKPYKIKSIHNGISLRSANETVIETKQRLNLALDFTGVIAGVVALMEPRKGHRVLIEALSILKKQDYLLANKLVVWFEGDGPIRKDLETLVYVRGLTDVVKFVGIENNVFDLMNALDLLILPSVSMEDFPNVTLEAMGLGKAVLASSIAGTPEQIVSRSTGVLVDPNDPEGLAYALRNLIDDQGIVRRFGGNGRLRFDRYFSAEVSVGKYLLLYED